MMVLLKMFTATAMEVRRPPCLYSGRRGGDGGYHLQLACLDFFRVRHVRCSVQIQV
ncbi:hypothetical protein Hanom_Chr04g00380721 [Helianthus anomalus]